MSMVNLGTQLIATAIGVAFTLGSNAIATAADLGFSVSGSFGDTVSNTYSETRENTVYRTFSGTYSYSASAPNLLESEVLFGRYSLSDFEIEVFGNDTSLATISPLNSWTGFLTVSAAPQPIPLIGLSFSNSDLTESFQLNFPGLINDNSLPTVALGTTFAQIPGYYRVATDLPVRGDNDFYLVSSGTVTAASVPEPSGSCH
jgi:hypothetical protein